MVLVRQSARAEVWLGNCRNATFASWNAFFIRANDLPFFIFYISLSIICPSWSPAGMPPRRENVALRHFIL
jgi:hypothetical protein